MTNSGSLLHRNHFLLTRLHSLLGIMPIGVFLIFHLTTNSSIVWGMLDSREGKTLLERGVRTFQSEVDFIHDTPFLLLVEIMGLWIPIAFHAIIGIYIIAQGRDNVFKYGYGANWRYTLQRISGYVGVVFIFYHVATLRWGWTFLLPGGVQWNHSYAASTTAAMLRGGDNWTAGGVAVSIAYFVCVTLLVFHFANGLWTSAITWGVTISERAQRRWGYVCAGVGAGLMCAAWASLIGFVLMNPAEARRFEEAHRAEATGLGQPYPVQPKP